MVSTKIASQNLIFRKIIIGHIVKVDDPCITNFSHPPSKYIVWLFYPHTSYTLIFVAYLPHLIIYLSLTLSSIIFSWNFNAIHRNLYIYYLFNYVSMFFQSLIINPKRNQNQLKIEGNEKTKIGWISHVLSHRWLVKHKPFHFGFDTRLTRQWETLFHLSFSRCKIHQIGYETNFFHFRFQYANAKWFLVNQCSLRIWFRFFHHNSNWHFVRDYSCIRENGWKEER